MNAKNAKNGKRYYWLKLPKSYFSHLEQKKMRKQEHGREMQIVYLRMMLLGIDKGGYIHYQGVYDSLEEELSEEFDEPVEIIRETLDYLKENNMITIDENLDCYVPKAVELTGSECSSAERMRNKRKRDEASRCDSGVTIGDCRVTSCDVEKEIEIEIEKEKRERDIKDICTEPEESVSMPPVISLILNDKSLHDIFQSDIDGWKELYPAVDILQELRKMKGWLDSNPAKRKTQRGIKRFINGWLAREQDRSGATADRDGTDGAGIRRFISGKSNEELEKGIHDIVTSRISQEALDRYHDKIHELIRLCCPFEIFTQEQIDYMRREWKMEPLHKDNAYVVPRADIYDFYDRKLGITEDTGID